jgi:hypothetical protein
VNTSPAVRLINNESLAVIDLEVLISCMLRILSLFHGSRQNILITAQQYPCQPFAQLKRKLKWKPNRTPT